MSGQVGAGFEDEETKFDASIIILTCDGQVEQFWVTGIGDAHVPG